MRVVQAVGGCAALVIGRAIVRDRCEPHEAARAFSTLMLIVSVGPMLAPTLGGWVITLFDWRAVFIFQCLAGGALLLAMHGLLSESLPAAPRATLSVATVATSYGQLFRDRTLIGYSLVGSFGLSALFCYVTGSPKVMIPLYQLSPQQFGWMMGLNGLAFMAASRLNVLLLRRQTPQVLLRRSVWIPPALGAAMTLLAAYFLRPPLVVIICVQLCFFISVARIGPNVSALALAPHSRNAGAAAAVLGTFQSLVPMAAGIAVAELGDGSILLLYLLMSCAVLLSLLSYGWVRRLAIAPQ
jgi:DHA1 family bicyclomycin/chloramphenicol resistance-like MFS transporter